MWAHVDGEHVAGAAKQESDATVHSEYKHHTSRGHRMARAREVGTSSTTRPRSGTSPLGGRH